MTTALRRQLEPLLDDPNIQNYLRMIRSAEHGDKVPDADRYSRAFGNRVIPDLSTYNEKFLADFRQTDGKMNKTSAQGAYQFIRNTWKGSSAAMGLTDFSPRSQDLAALHLLHQNGSIPDIQAGNYAAALQKDGQTWASLPTSRHPQPRQKMEQVAKWLGVEPSKSAGAEPAGSYQLAGGRTVTGRTPAQMGRLDQIANSPYSDEQKERMVDVYAKIPEYSTPKDLLGVDLPNVLDKDLMQLINRA